MMIFQFKFVESVPVPMEEEVIYISITYSTVMHLCPCGCRNEVVTKLSPTRWKLTFDGESVSLDPSIGNWSLPCRSHYWIENNEIIWAESWSEDKVQKSRKNKNKKNWKSFLITLQSIFNFSGHVINKWINTQLNLPSNT